MGIPNLLPNLKSAKRNINFDELSEKSVAIDGHCWLHAALRANKYSTKKPSYLGYVRNRVKELSKHRIKLIVVFDGQFVPIKGVETEKRKKIIEQPKEKTEVSKHKYKITEDMIHKTIELLDKLEVQHIIAPFEADPQLAYLNLTGQVDAIISNDSDLLVFGCKQVIYPEDRSFEIKNGYYSIKQENIFDIKETPFKNASPRRVFMDLTDYNTTKLRHLCILAGCDYLESLSNVGLKTAFFALKETDHDVERAIEELLKDEGEAQKSKKIDVYLKGFRNANAGFLYQHVFDPRTRMYTRLNPLPESIDFDIDVLGESPVDKDIPLLRSNRAIIAPQEVEEEKEEDRNIQTKITTTMENITGELESLQIKQISSTTTTSTKTSAPLTLLPIEEHNNHRDQESTTTNDGNGSSSNSLTIPSNNDYDTVSSSQEGYYRLTNDEQSQRDELADQLESLYIKSTMETAKERVIVGGDGDGSIDESFVAATTTTSTSASTHFKVKEKEVETTTSL